MIMTRFHMQHHLEYFVSIIETNHVDAPSCREKAQSPVFDPQGKVVKRLGFTSYIYSPSSLSHHEYWGAIAESAKLHFQCAP